MKVFNLIYIFMCIRTSNGLTCYLVSELLCGLKQWCFTITKGILQKYFKNLITSHHTIIITAFTMYKLINIQRKNSKEYIVILYITWLYFMLCLQNEKQEEEKDQDTTETSDQTISPTDNSTSSSNSTSAAPATGWVCNIYPYSTTTNNIGPMRICQQ